MKDDLKSLLNAKYYTMTGVLYWPSTCPHTMNLFFSLLSKYSHQKAQINLNQANRFKKGM